MNAPISLLFAIGLLTLVFVGSAAVVGFLLWRAELRLRHSPDHDEGRRDT